MTPMFTMIGHCRQDNIIYKCTKLHDHSSNKKNRYPLRCACHVFVHSGEIRPSFNIFFLIYFFVFMGTFI